MKAPEDLIIYDLSADELQTGSCCRRDGCNGRLTLKWDETSRSHSTRNLFREGWRFLTATRWNGQLPAHKKASSTCDECDYIVTFATRSNGVAGSITDNKAVDGSESKLWKIQLTPN